MLGKIKHHLKKGIPFPLGKFDLTLKVEKKKDLHDAVLEMSFARHLESKFPQLQQKFGFELTPENVNVVLQFYLEYVPLISPASKEARIRTLLQRLKNELIKREIDDLGLQNAATKAMALSDLSEGLPDRALSIKDDAIHHTAWMEEVKKLETAYGAQYISQLWPNADRGASIQYYLESHLDLLRGKKVMHFAPEASLKKWFETNYSTLSLAAYHTIDGSLEDVNDRFDIVDIQLPSESFDVIICHRVLEHIPDDRSALKELYRLLKTGGVMNFSVPQMPHRDQTAEWIIPDESHHGHVRHYGADLEQRLTEIGFEVKLEPWLLQQKREDLLKLNAYPLRMYQCWKLNS